MVKEDDFTLISVSSDEDDDIVIQAGVREPVQKAVDEVEPDPAKEDIDSQESDVSDASDDAAPDEVDESEAADEADEADESSEPEIVLDAEALRVKKHLDEAGLSVEDLDDEARAEYERHMARSHARAQAEKMLTTEDDLHTKMPFSNMQRGIVILLVLLAIAFVVYWMVGR